MLHCKPEFFNGTFPSEQVLGFAGEVFLRAALADDEEGAEDGGEEELATTQPEVEHQQKLERGLGGVLMRGHPNKNKSSNSELRCHKNLFEKFPGVPNKSKSISV